MKWRSAHAISKHKGETRSDRGHAHGKRKMPPRRKNKAGGSPKCLKKTNGKSLSEKKRHSQITGREWERGRTISRAKTASNDSSSLTRERREEWQTNSKSKAEKRELLHRP